MKTKQCFYCGTDKDLRPYGPKGSMVCFKCATATPERDAETQRNFAIQLDSSGPIAIIDGTDVGPYPVKHSRLAKELE